MIRLTKNFIRRRSSLKELVKEICEMIPYEIDHPTMRSHILSS